MPQIQLNKTATHFLEITDNDFEVIKKYFLFRDLIDSTGYVTDDVLDKLKLNIKPIMTSTQPMPEDLVEFYLNIICHDKMKAFGLKQLIEAYVEWHK